MTAVTGLRVRSVHTGRHSMHVVGHLLPCYKEHHVIEYEYYHGNISEEWTTHR